MHVAIITAEVLSILYLLIILFSMLRGEKKSRTSIMFITCIVVAVAGVGMDLLSYILEYIATDTYWLIVVNMLSFFGYDFELMAFGVYIWTIVAEKEKVSHDFVHFISIACLVDILFIIIGTATRKLFIIENGNFVTGPWYNFGGVIGFIILASMLIFAINKRKSVGYKPVIFIIIFFVITYASMFITLFTGFDSYMYVCMALIMMLVYMILQRGEIESGQMRERIVLELSLTDVLTKLNNRRAFENALTEILNISIVGVIFCDVNGLKNANDNLGHVAGDALLQHFSELLKKRFPSSDIFRISGDEFVVFRPNINEETFVLDVMQLKDDVAKQQDIASIGHAYGNGSNVFELVSMAEKDMYDDKKSYYERHSLNRRRS